MLVKLLLTDLKKVRFGCGIKTNCPHVGPGPATEQPFEGVFLKDPSPYLNKFRRKLRKTPNSLVGTGN